MILELLNSVIRRSLSELTQERMCALALRRKLLKVRRYQEGTITIEGYVWRYADAPSFLSAYQQIMVDGWYAYDQKVVRETPIILDCGANIGLASLHFARLSPEAKVVAFEPDPKLFRMLTDNLTRNGLNAHVEAVNAAVWGGRAEGMRFQADGGDGGYMDCDLTRGFRVPVVDLRKYLSSQVGLLKMDIEGAEVDVLNDSFEMLANVRQIIVELHSVVGRPQRLSEAFSTLEKAGFRLQVNNIHRWMNPLVADPRMGRYDQLLIVYGRQAD
jgi:FkbM family methyltransferase